MKLVFDAEDCIVGIIFGLLLVALSEKFFTIPYTKIALMVVIPIYAIMIILDIANEIVDISRHFLFIASSILHNIFDLILCLAFYALFFNFSITGIDLIVPYLSNVTVLFWLGAFEVVSHVIWIILLPFNN